MVDLREWLDAADADDSLFEGLLAALTCVVHDEMGKEGVEKARRDISRLVPRKRIRVSRHGAHLQTYYYNPDKVRGKKVEGKKVLHPVEIAHQHGEHLKGWAERMAEYYKRRAEAFQLSGTKEFAEKLWEQVRQGKTRLGGEVERYLEQLGLTREKPTIGSPFNAPLMHFLFSATFSHHEPPPEFHDLHERLFPLMEKSHRNLMQALEKYDKEVKGWVEAAARLRESKAFRNMAVAQAYVADPRQFGELRDALGTIFRERQNLNRAQMLALVGAWSVWTGEPINADLENKLRVLFDAERRKESAWRRYLEHQLLEWELSHRALDRLNVRGYALDKLTEKQLRDEIENEWRKLNPDAKEGFYERQKKLLAELETRRRTAFKHALRVYDHLAEGIAKVSPKYKETIDQIRRINKQLRDSLSEEMRLRAKIAALERLGHDTTSARRDLDAIRRTFNAFKELHNQLVGSMLAHSATNGRVPLPHWAAVSGTFHNILNARYAHAERHRWQWEQLAQIKDYIAELTDEKTRHAIRQYGDIFRRIINEFPNAPEAVVKFIANVRSGGLMYEVIARAFRELAENPSFSDLTKAAIMSHYPFRHFTL
jgi:hypothetical protein